MVPEKSLGTGIGKIEYRKKVSEPVSRKFGTEKSTGIGIENIWYRIKVSVSVSFNIFGTVTHCPALANGPLSPISKLMFVTTTTSAPLCESPHHDNHDNQCTMQRRTTQGSSAQQLLRTETTLLGPFVLLRRRTLIIDSLVQGNFNLHVRLDLVFVS